MTKRNYFKKDIKTIKKQLITSLISNYQMILSSGVMKIDGH